MWGKWFFKKGSNCITMIRLTLGSYGTKLPPRNKYMSMIGSSIKWCFKIVSQIS